MLILALVLRNSVAGIEQDQRGAMQALEDSEEATNDISVRAIIANELSECEPSAELDVDRVFRILQRTVAKEKDKNELRKAGRLISCCGSTRKLSAPASTSQVMYS